MKKTYFLFLAFTILIVGCATTPKWEKLISKSKVFNASYDNVWNATIKALVTSGENITAIQKEDGIISFRRPLPINEIRKYASTNLLYGYPHSVANINIILVKQNSGATEVTVNAKIVAGGTLQLDSKGIIEKEYLDKITTFLIDK